MSRKKKDPAERTCVVCGTPFTTTAHNKMTCCWECSQKWNRHRNELRRKKLKLQHEAFEKILAITPNQNTKGFYSGTVMIIKQYFEDLSKLSTQIEDDLHG